MLYGIVFIVGSLIGSFLNVCIYRMPRDRSIVWPSSRCTSCSNPVRPWDNIPLLSFLLLGGKCRICKAPISLRYPFIEALNAFLYVFLLWRFGPNWPFLIYALFCSALIVITFIDLDFQIIPDQISLPGIPLGLLAGTLILPDPFMRAVSLGWKASFIGAASGFLFYYIIAVVGEKIFRKEAMGGGDIKMMAMVGGFLGWKGVILTTFLGSLFGSMTGIFMMLFQGRERGSQIPFGPFLALGAVASLFFGQEIIIWYLYR
jgi:leader peptidase (prepilin peptidase)/N-methyltransferase